MEGKRERDLERGMGERRETTVMIRDDEMMREIIINEREMNDRYIRQI